MFTLPGGAGISVVYTMQKTCQCSGREFYGLGRYNRETHAFALLDATSDVGNNAWDGGEGYAHANVLDPRPSPGFPHGRMLWTGAVIEGDRDPSSCAGSGFPMKWMASRGWFGTLTLPRVVVLENRTAEAGRPDLFLQTPPLPELAALRQPTGSLNATKIAVPSGGAAVPLVFSGRSFEVDAEFELPIAAADGTRWDVGLQLLWSGGTGAATAGKPRVDGEPDGAGVEFTRVGIRDGTMMPGVDLWDEVNGDRHRDTGGLAEACEQGCKVDAGCGAWTFTQTKNGTVCRTKAMAQRSLVVVDGSPGCFLPNYGGWGDNASSISGFKQQPGLRFALLYIDRVHSSADPAVFGSFGYAQMLRIVPGEDSSLQLHAFVDRSIVEVFGQGGRAAVTARVYPTLPAADGIALYNAGPNPVIVRAVRAWQLGSANASRAEVMAALGPSVEL